MASFMTLRIIVLCVTLVFVAALGSLQAGYGRLLLWRTIEACLLDHRIFDAPTPCLNVTPEDRTDPGYAILRNPLDKSHIIVAPTVRIVGIEAAEAREPRTATYFADAWSNRRLAFPRGLPDVPADDIGLAINSQRGRTQDQFHIHVDCLRQDVKERLIAARLPLLPGQWSQVMLVDGGPPYSVTSLAGNLAESNVIDLSAAHLQLSKKEMPSLTLAIVALRTDPDNPRFVLLARRDFYRQHAELLLDHDCLDYRRRQDPHASRGSDE